MKKGRPIIQAYTVIASKREKITVNINLSPNEWNTFYLLVKF